MSRRIATWFASFASLRLSSCRSARLRPRRASSAPSAALATVLRATKRTPNNASTPLIRANSRQGNAASAVAARRLVRSCRNGSLCLKSVSAAFFAASGAARAAGSSSTAAAACALRQSLTTAASGARAPAAVGERIWSPIAPPRSSACRPATTWSRLSRSCTSASASPAIAPAPTLARRWVCINRSPVTSATTVSAALLRKSSATTATKTSTIRIVNQIQLRRRAAGAPSGTGATPRAAADPREASPASLFIVIVPSRAATTPPRAKDLSNDHEKAMTSSSDAQCLQRPVPPRRCDVARARRAVPYRPCAAELESTTLVAASSKRPCRNVRSIPRDVEEARVGGEGREVDLLP